MKIIDFCKKGQSVRFYLGDDEDKEYTGDDWNDTPYEHNAGPVDQRYVKGYTDRTFPFDDMVLEPADGDFNSHFCKNDMKMRRTPCIIVIPENQIDWYDQFVHYVGMDGLQRYYFGDKMEPQHLTEE
jgi:hypothetical protein